MTLKVRLLDYGAGNLHSLGKALARAGAEVDVVRDPADVVDARALVLPGVGAFGAAARALAPYREQLRLGLAAGKPMLAICLGLQLLLEESEESPGEEGLGLIRGRVGRLTHPKLPQIGWNELDLTPDPLFEGLPAAPHVYYVNSFAAEPAEAGVTIATSDYGGPFVAAVRKHNTWGLQFHPEKSSRLGLAMIDNWVRLAEEAA